MRIIGDASVKKLLEQWTGEFEVDGEVCKNLDALILNDGDDFHIILEPLGSSFIRRFHGGEDEEDMD